MRSEPVEVPGWILGVLGGVLFGVAMGAFIKHDGSSWTAAGVGVIVTGVPFGLAMGWWSARWRRGLKDAEGDISAEKARLAQRAATGGPAPEDDEVRSAALRIASRYLESYTGRTRWLFIIVPAAILLGTIAGAAGGSPWELLGAPVAAGLLYARWYWPRRLRRRIALLTEATPETRE
ncbi:hypothetical protein GCM10009630_29570 [Kribbella jejuensis]|uniref:Uncharacterized protein n=1 Tax=Kribbella jejuensis TaxID=236068 RepID=A0A542EQ34_9ACTN|nr:hypothetical protein [Kribbella jejuensis]TQJ17460.1 hypothetical protein FB475_1579 [Kribbella jejuensis]